MLKEFMIALGALGVLAPAFSAMAGDCPAYLDHQLKKLHSSEEVNLCEEHAGSPILIVNTASHCGFTPQFEGLEALHKQYVDRGLVVVGFSSNDFHQEAASEQKAAEVCYVNYGVTFTMVASVSVKGDGAHPVFRELARQSTAPKWNFNKYVIDSDGNVVRHFNSGTRPDSPLLIESIESVL